MFTMKYSKGPARMDSPSPASGLYGLPHGQ